MMSFLCRRHHLYRPVYLGIFLETTRYYLISIPFLFRTVGSLYHYGGPSTIIITILSMAILLAMIIEGK